MATDPSIILAGTPDPVSYQGAIANTLKLKSMQLEQQAEQQKLATEQQGLQAQNTLKSLLSDPNSIDPETGLPTTKAIGQALAISPEYGTKLAQGMATIENQRAEAAARTSAANLKAHDAVDEDVYAPALEAYDQDLEKFGPDVARANAQKTYTSARESVVNSGILSRDQADALATKFDPDTMRGQSKLYRAWKEKQQSDALAAKKEADAAAKAAAEQAELDRHNRAMEHNQQQRISISVGNNGGGAPTPGSAEEIDYLAHHYKDLGTLPPVGRNGKMATQRDAIIKRITELDKADGSTAEGDIAGGADIKATAAGLTNLGKMRSSVAQAEGNAGKEADLVLSLTDKGAAGGTPVFNKWAQGVRTGVFGDPDASKFQTAVESFKNEYVKVLSTQGGMSGGMSSDAARREADTYINPNLSKAQIKANIGVMRQSMKNRTAAINEAYEDTKKHLEKPSGGGDGGKTAHYVFDPASGKLVAQ